ncbi:MAG: TRAP transporter small permease subunit [Rhizobiales bacterium]|nr:TRAP transporter small permease subunit [Hyphomicrobiales bacterium]
MRIVERIYDRIVDLLAVVAAVLLIAVMLATVFKVALRGLFGEGIIGVDQLSGTAMVYMTFLGAIWVLRNNGHVCVDILIGNPHGGRTRGLIFMSSLIGAAICFCVAWFGVGAVQLSIARGVMVATELELPRWIGLIPIPIGCFLLGIEFLRRARDAWCGQGPHLAPPHIEQ